MSRSRNAIQLVTDFPILSLESCNAHLVWAEAKKEFSSNTPCNALIASSKLRDTTVSRFLSVEGVKRDWATISLGVKQGVQVPCKKIIATFVLGAVIR